MTPSIDLNGRIPRIRRAISPRIMVMFLALVVLCVCVFFYTLHSKFVEQQVKIQAQHNDIVGADAAESNQNIVKTHAQSLADLQNQQNALQGPPQPAIPSVTDAAK